MHVYVHFLLDNNRFWNNSPLFGINEAPVPLGKATMDLM